MSEDWVFNASPLITLGKVEALRLLPALCHRVIVPAAVRREIEAGPTDDAARLFVQSSAPTIVENPTPPAALQQWGLGPGETSVLAVASTRPACRAVLDDALARRACRSIQLPCIGAIGIVLRAARRGLIPSAHAMLDRLREAGLFLDEALIQQILSDIEDRPR